MAKKYLVLDGPRDQQQFFLLQQGFIAGGNTFPSKGLDVLHRELEVLDAFDAIGDVSPLADDATREMSRLLRPGRQVLALSDGAYVRLRQNLEAAPWRTEKARQVAALLAWIASPETVDSRTVDAPQL